MSRILIVPEAVQTEIGESFLDRRSFSVQTARAADDALRLAADWRPALIIFGSEIEGMTADEFSRAVGEDPDLAETKLLMVAADPDDSGAHLRVSRPIDRGELLRAIGALLDVQIRRSRRRTVDLTCTMRYKTGADGRTVDAVARIRRLSETGVLVATESELKAGAVVDLEFSIPEAPELLRSTSIVLYVDDEAPEYGLEFVDMGAHERKLIRRYVAGE